MASQSKKDEKLEKAFKAGDVVAAEAALKEGASPETVSQYRISNGMYSEKIWVKTLVWSLIDSCSRDTALTLMRLLLSYGLNPNKKIPGYDGRGTGSVEYYGRKDDPGQSLVDAMCRNDDSHICDPALLEMVMKDFKGDPFNGVDISDRFYNPDFERLPLKFFCDSRQWERAEILIRYGGAEGVADRIVWKAIKDGMPSPILKKLIDKVKDINFGQGEALRQAIDCNRKDIFDYILETKKPDMNTVHTSDYNDDSVDGTLLDVALYGTPKIDMALEIVKRGADVNAKLLKIAAQNGGIDLVNLVFEKAKAAGTPFAELDLKDALFAASTGKGTSEIIKALVNAGADVNAVDAKGMTPMMHAAAAGNAALFDVFEELGGRWQDQDKQDFSVYDHLVQAISTQKEKDAEDRNEEKLAACLAAKERYSAASPAASAIEADKEKRSQCLRQKFEKVNDHSVRMLEGDGLTITFNFFMQQVFYRGMGSEAVQTPVMNFDRLPNRQVLDEAYEALIDMGGSAPPPDVVLTPGKKARPVIQALGGGV